MRNYVINMAGMVSTFTGAIVTYSNIEQTIRVASVTVGLAIGVITLWRMRKK